MATHALGDLVEAWAFGVGTSLAKTRDAAKNDAMVHFFKRLVIDSETFFDTWTHVLDDDVGVCCHFVEDRAPFFSFEI